MPGFQPVLFDLDGTLADTHAGILAAVSEVLDRFGLEQLPAAEVRRLTGRGIDALVESVLTRARGSAPEPELLSRAVALYHEVYWRTCAVEIALVPGIIDVLRAPGVRRALLTNKARRYTEKILATTGLEGCFNALVAGDDPGARLKPDPWPVREALQKLGEPATHAILVGDTESDVDAAAAARIPSCIVRWGSGGERAAARGTWSVGSVEELARLLAEGTVPAPAR
ncbi:MAG: HAD-IA family hydrolase [Myxococcaceae bacterium]|nr:HAD-IA family hydrolase [Myxococcaceae bacterium]